MKKNRIFKGFFATLITFTAISLFSITAYAKEPDGLIEDFTDAVPDEYTDMVTNPDTITDSISLPSLFDYLVRTLSGQKSGLISFFLFLMGMCALTALTSVYQHKFTSAVRFGISAIAISALLAKIISLFSSVMKSLEDANGFFSALIPVFCAINASGGGVGAAAVQGAGMSLTVAFVATVVSRFLPFVAVIVFFLEILALLGADGGVARSVKNLYMKTLGAITLIIATLLAFQTVISSASDGVAIRTAKYGASNMIPIVGSTVSSALSALSGGLAYAKSVVGVGAVAVLLYIFLSPLVLLLLYRLAISLSASLEGYIRAEGGGITSPFLGIMDCLIASYSLCTVLYIFEIILFIKYGLVI